ncbi:MAG: VWA domain-containing protein [Clostridiales bacterium]|nr:VWA domain-containing protein [Bacillota bacterium]NLK90150.1 VWA domain-containing protein [Clostridiales bacterium]
MKMKRTEIVFILDRSGSMSGLEEDTIGGYNSMLEKQQKEEGEAIVTTVLFDHEYEIIHDRINIREIMPITKREYFVRGSTALLDAIGITVNKIINSTRNTKKEYRADKVMFVIITDGMENSSHEYSYEKVKAMIERQKERYKWEFVFLGANIDAISTAARFGIGENRAANYNADSEGLDISYNSVCNMISDIRHSGEIDDDWKESIDKDYKKRGGRRRR